MKFLLALQFLTRVPLTLRGPIEESDLAGAMAYFPVIGLILGASAAGLYTLLSLILASPVCDFFAIAFLVVITGNMHGDGLMDAADGLFSDKPRERILEIMKDSRVGSHGDTAGTLVLVSKFVLLGQLPGEAKILSLVLVPAMGRWAQVYAATVHPYARIYGGTGNFIQQVGNREIFWSSLTVLVTVALLLGLKGSILAGTVFIGTAGLGWYISRKIGGMTGDVLGAMNECIEVLTLVTLQIILIKI